MDEETIYQYDGNGNLIQKIDAKNQKVAYTYGDTGRLTEIKYFEASDHSNPVKTEAFTYYDKVGNLKTYSDGTTSAQYGYDDLYRKVSEAVNYGGFQKSYTYEYYKNGSKKTFTGPDGVTYTYTYNSNNQLTGVQIPGVGSITHASYNWTRPAMITLPGGSKKDYAYDPLMRVQNITTKDPGQNTLLSYNYTYDKMDNIQSKQTEHGQYAYDYDNLYRLAGAENPVQEDEAFTYDPVGNRLTSSGVSDWNYNQNNELTGYDNASYVYDNNGNMTQKTVDGVVTNFVYNVEDRLIAVRDGSDALIASYYYDPFGRRLWKEVGGTKTYFMYVDEGLIGEYDSTGTEIKTYGYKSGSTWTTDPLFMKQGTSYYFYHNDHLGTPQKLTSTNGAVAWSATYSSFGEATVDASSTITNSLRYPGQYYDQETGLHYNYHRYYDPRTGRYLREDPIGIEEQLIHLYIYARNNPLKYIDIFGLKCSKDCPDCPGGEWDVDIGYGAGVALIYGWGRSDVTFTCLSTEIKCKGNIDCTYLGLYAALGANWSIDFHEPVGPGRTISGYPCYSDIKNYEKTGWELGFIVGSTSGNNLAFGIGKGLGVAKIKCTGKYITCHPSK